jgi:hypothetical protein
VTVIERQLQALGAQHDLVQWASPYGQDWNALFTACPRADWILGLAAKLGAKRESLALAAIGCTRVALGYLPEPNLVVEQALSVLEAWTRAEASPDACAAQSERLAQLSNENDAVIDAVLQAAIAALETRDTPEAAAFSAACTAQTAVLAAGECAMSSALRFTQERCADIVRGVLTPARLAALAAARA